MENLFFVIYLEAKWEFECEIKARLIPSPDLQVTRQDIWDWRTQGWGRLPQYR